VTNWQWLAEFAIILFFCSFSSFPFLSSLVLILLRLCAHGAWLVLIGFDLNHWYWIGLDCFLFFFSFSFLSSSPSFATCSRVKQTKSWYCFFSYCVWCMCLSIGVEWWFLVDCVLCCCVFYVNRLDSVSCLWAPLTLVSN